jgi:hypothetical protein
MSLIAGLAKRVIPVLLLLAVNAAIFMAVDWTLVKLDLLRPPFAYGVPELGFGYPGVRRSSDFGAPRSSDSSGRLTIAMVGDSHSQIVFDHPLDSHEFVLESVLREHGYAVDVISAGRGRYSPLQEYVLFRRELRDKHRPAVLLMNFYSGNDFYDMLRPDDRPYFARDAGNAIVMRDPLWIFFVNPESRSWIERSRLLWGIDEISSRLGYPRVITRLRMLSAAADRAGHSYADTVRYLASLRRSQEPRLAYPAAFSAQILNQALYFQHFPESREEAVAYMRHLLEQARAENPDLVLVLSAIPSAAALMNAMPDDVRSLWHDTLARTGLTEAWVARLENDLVDRLKSMSGPAGWVFVDLRDCLQGRSSAGELYASHDLHISAAASRLIGRCQADTLLAAKEFSSVRTLSGDSPQARGHAASSRRK